MNSHPELVNGLINQYRRYIDGLHLLGSNACVELNKPLDYSGRLLIINPIHLKDEYRTPDYQLFYAESGFGCDPNASGRKVFGLFLKDDERTHFNRSDFIGVADEDRLPDWAKQKLGDISSGQEQDSGFDIKMKM